MDSEIIEMEFNPNSSESMTDRLSSDKSDFDIVIIIFTSLILGLMILTTIIGKLILFQVKKKSLELKHLTCWMKTLPVAKKFNAISILHSDICRIPTIFRPDNIVKMN